MACGQLVVHELPKPGPQLDVNNDFILQQKRKRRELTTTATFKKKKLPPSAPETS